MLAQVGAAEDSAYGHADRAADDAPAVREYRIGELAREAGISVRTLRYYQERKLLPPPRRQGRIGWYSQAHLNRLRVIGQLLARGHALGGIGELLSAWEQGYDLADLLGFERAMTAPWSDEIPVQVTVAEISNLGQSGKSGRGTVNHWASCSAPRFRRPRAAIRSVPNRMPKNKEMVFRKPGSLWLKKAIARITKTDTPKTMGSPKGYPALTPITIGMR